MLNYLVNPSEQLSLAGSWHPNGYHGHYRSRSRAEFSSLYRQFAKPPPPEKFNKRNTEDVSKHIFSHHDNRQAFLNDATMFGKGLGKKKIESVNKSKWNPRFIAWEEKEQKLNSQESMYQHDFCNHLNKTKLLSGRQNCDNKPLTVYGYTFNTNHDMIKKEMKEAQIETYQRFVNKHRAKSQMANERNNVASCLVWYDSIKKNQSNNQSEADHASRPKTVAVCNNLPNLSNTVSPNASE